MAVESVMVAIMTLLEDNLGKKANSYLPYHKINLLSLFLPQGKSLLLVPIETIKKVRCYSLSTLRKGAKRDETYFLLISLTLLYLSIVTKGNQVILLGSLWFYFLGWRKVLLRGLTFMGLVGLALPILVSLSWAFPVDLNLAIDLVGLHLRQENLPLTLVGVSLSGGLILNNVGIRGRVQYHRNLTYRVDATYLPVYHSISGVYGVYASEPALSLFIGLLVLSNMLVWFADTKLIQEVLEKKSIFPVFFVIAVSAVYGYPCAWSDFIFLKGALSIYYLWLYKKKVHYAALLEIVFIGNAYIFLAWIIFLQVEVLSPLVFLLTGPFLL